MENREGERREGKEEEGVAPQRAKINLHTLLRMDIIHTPMTRYIHILRTRGIQTTLHTIGSTPHRTDTPHTISTVSIHQKVITETGDMTEVMVVRMEGNLGVM